MENEDISPELFAADAPETALMAFLEVMIAGGPVVAILLGMSLMAMGLVLAKIWQFAMVQPGRFHEAREAVTHFRAGEIAAACAAAATAKGVIAAPVALAIEALAAGKPLEQVRADSYRLASEQLEALRGYLRPLEVIASLAPLLGLFGTVLGMIAAFAALEAAGSQVDPAILSGGIWEALLTTAVGLAVAIPTVVMVNWFERSIERCQHQMESALTALLAADAAAGVGPPAVYAAAE